MRLDSWRCAGRPLVEQKSAAGVDGQGKRSVTRACTAAAILICCCGSPASAKEAVAAAPAVSAGVAKGAGSISGIWVNDGYKTSSKHEIRAGLIVTADGEAPPMQQWAAELTNKRLKDSDDGRPYATTKSNCLPGGVPQVMLGPKLPIQILETPGQVTMLIEEFNNFRIIRLDAKHKNDPDLTYMGDSIGRWEGDTLVVDTIALTDKTALDPVGTPHSDALHVVERIRRIDKDTLEVDIAMDDPKTFTKPWITKTAFKAVPDWGIQESYCENNRNQPKDGVVTVLPSKNE